jgi:epoxyqueuosine reductase
LISVDQSRRIKSLARSLGFDLAAFASIDIPEEDRDFFLRWCAEGKAAGMGWLSREPARRAEPRTLLSEALGIITLGVSYFQGPVPPAPASPSGRVARYAWGEDYHDVILLRLAEFESRLRDFFPDLKARPAIDAQPLLERAFARRAGLGFAGKNTNLIAPRAGSWIFLTELVANLELPPDGPVSGSSGPGNPARVPSGAPGVRLLGARRPQGCGSCVQCQTQCPTGALDTPYALDSRLCISYHTIENRGWIPRELRPKMGNWLFGCDECQEVCPFNARAKETLWPEFRADRGAGPWVSLAEVLDLGTEEAFKERFKGTALLRARRAGLVRNACVVAANVGADGRTRSLLEERLDHDPDPLVRGHAAWALGRSGRKDSLTRALPRENDSAVREEILRSLESA